MRLLAAVVIALTLAATQATAAKRSTQLGFAEPGDIIAAEGNFTHLSAAKGLKAAILATAAPDAQIFAPQLMRVTNYANGATLANFPSWHTGQVWMSCDGSIAVTHGVSQQTNWYITIWKRRKGGSYKWVLEENGPIASASADFDMISASVADCPIRRPRASEPAPDRGKAPASDYTSGQSDDATLAWSTALAADGSRTFMLQIKQDGVLHEVLRAVAAPGA